MRAGVAVSHVHSDGRGVEAQDGVEALQPLLQAGVRTQEILKRGLRFERRIGVAGV
jgi:hypothetical protein